MAIYFYFLLEGEKVEIPCAILLYIPIIASLNPIPLYFLICFLNRDSEYRPLISIHLPESCHCFKRLNKRGPNSMIT